MSRVTIESLRTVSESNQRGHWSKHVGRKRSQRMATQARCREGLKRPSLPCVVLLTRIAPRLLDDDNLRGALKSVRDGVADWLGVDDRHAKIVRYEYAQEQATKRYAVRVEVQNAT